MTLFASRWVAIAVSVGLFGCGPSKDELQAELDQVRGELDQAQTRNKTLSEKIADLDREVAAMQVRIEEFEAERSLTESELEKLRDEHRERQDELAAYKRVFKRLKKLIDAGTITVVFRKGRMMVELESAVLFDSGKTKLKPNGMSALEQLAQALATVKNRDFMVGGHTDNVPIRTRRYKSNWELSSQRAVVVANFMIDKGFPPQHLSAAGYGEYDPLETNDTEEGKARNRRIEIVLVPNLGKLKGIQEFVEAGEPKKKKKKKKKPE